MGHRRLCAPNLWTKHKRLSALPQVLHLIGEQFEGAEDICGVACNIRKQDRVVLWTKTATNEALQTNLGKQLKGLLGIPASQTIGFMSHEQAKKETTGSNRAAKTDTYTV
jgi:translation initiation factor 4E